MSCPEVHAATWALCGRVTRLKHRALALLLERRALWSGRRSRTTQVAPKLGTLEDWIRCWRLNSRHGCTRLDLFLPLHVEKCFAAAALLSQRGAPPPSERPSFWRSLGQSTACRSTDVLYLCGPAASPQLWGIHANHVWVEGRSSQNCPRHTRRYENVYNCPVDCTPDAISPNLDVYGEVREQQEGTRPGLLATGVVEEPLEVLRGSGMNDTPMNRRLTRHD